MEMEAFLGGKLDIILFIVYLSRDFIALIHAEEIVLLLILIIL